MRHRAVGIAISGMLLACGGASRAPEPRRSAGLPPSSGGGTDVLMERLHEVAARLAPCQSDVEAGARSAIAISAECRQALRDLVAGCGTADLRELEASDRVTEPCKESLWKLLPVRDSYRSRVLVMGTARGPHGLDVYLAASDADGEPAPAAFGELRVELEVEGRLAVVEPTAATPLPARCEAPVFTASSILDYSGSMSDRDVDESIEILRALYDAIPEGCLETDVVLFSDVVRRTHEPTADRAVMSRAVARDDRFPRETTALVDALGDGARGVSKRRAPVRLLVVATDGKENASTRWSYAEVVETAQDAGVRIVSFGSLLSDIGFLEQVGADTGGFFVYRPRPSVLAAASRTVGRLLASTRRVHLDDTRLAAATHVVIAHGTARVRVPIR